MSLSKSAEDSRRSLLTPFEEDEQETTQQVQQDEMNKKGDNSGGENQQQQSSNASPAQVALGQQGREGEKEEVPLETTGENNDQGESGLEESKYENQYEKKEEQSLVLAVETAEEIRDYVHQRRDLAWELAEPLSMGHYK